MSKRIVWTGSMSYSVGEVKIMKNVETTVSDEIIALLPKDGYTVLGDTPIEVKKPWTAPEVKEVKPNDISLATLKGEKPEESGGISTLDKMFLNNNTVATMKQKALAVGIEVPAELSTKPSIFKYMLDHGFKVG